MLFSVNYYELIFNKYHNEIIVKIRFLNPNNDTIELSNNYSLGELCNIIHLWKTGELLGSFGVGTKLADNAAFNIITE